MERYLKLVLVSCLIMAYSMSNAQFGLGVKYANLTSSPWTARSGYPYQGIETSAYYWFRLKDKRIEFLPEVGYAFIADGQGDNASLDADYAFAAFNVDIYLFDLLNDCDCPTFSKQGTFFQRSFFIELSPGLDYQFLEGADISASPPSDYDDQSFTFRFGFGIGFDIGVSDLLTVTPLFKYNFRTRPDWDPELIIGESTIPDGNEWLFTAGIRAVFRPDYTRRYR